MSIDNDKDIKTSLTDEQYRIMRQKGTEAPFTGKYVSDNREGFYKCSACEQVLFSSKTKFQSGTGWPSFTAPEDFKNIELKEDNSHGMIRTEVLCKNCGSHLGHVFADNPSKPNKKRYCINSVCLIHEKDE